jgi:hypothetical protein
MFPILNVSDFWVKGREGGREGGRQSGTELTRRAVAQLIRRDEKKSLLQ